MEVENRRDVGPSYSKSLKRLIDIFNGLLPIIVLIDRLSGLQRKENGDENLHQVLGLKSEF